VAKIDDLLTRELEGAAEPGDPDGVVEHVMRRGRRRGIVRRARVVSLAATVVVGTLLGGYGLTRAFKGDSDRKGVSAPGARNGMIVFAATVPPGHKGVHLYLLDPITGQVSELTTGRFLDSRPAFSPDGTRVMFDRSSLDAPSGYSLWVIGVDGTGLRRITPPDAVDPAWSPDGTRVAFVSNRQHHEFAVYVMKLVGTGLVRISDPSFGDAESPAWSPDGTRIAFSARKEAKPYNWDLYTVAPDGTHLARLTTNPRQGEIDPAWSPDGKRIVFAAGPNALCVVFERPKPGCYQIHSDGTGYPTELYLIDPDSTHLTRLTHDRFDEGMPTWSPDGRLIVFRKSRPGGSSLFAMDADGSSLRQLTTVDAVDPSWQPLLSR
jgi:TolB protein